MRIPREIAKIWSVSVSEIESTDVLSDRVQSIKFFFSLFSKDISESKWNRVCYWLCSVQCYLLRMFLVKNVCLNFKILWSRGLCVHNIGLTHSYGKESSIAIYQYLKRLSNFSILFQEDFSEEDAFETFINGISFGEVCNRECQLFGVIGVRKI